MASPAYIPLFPPILDGQARHAFEFAAIVGDQDKAPRACLAGDQDVERPNGLADAREMCPDFTRLLGIFPVEFERCELQRVQDADILVGPTAFVGAVIELVDDDRGQSDDGWFQSTEAVARR